MEPVETKDSLYGAYVTYGPISAFFAAILAVFVITDFRTWFSSVVEIIIALPYLLLIILLFYFIGVFPALLTAFLTEKKLKKSSFCSWYASAGYGALSSFAFLGFPVLFINMIVVTQSGEISGFFNLSKFYFVIIYLGFLGTLPAWYLTQQQQKSIAAEFSKKID